MLPLPHLIVNGFKWTQSASEKIRRGGRNHSHLIRKVALELVQRVCGRVALPGVASKDTSVDAPWDDYFGPGSHETLKISRFFKIWPAPVSLFVKSCDFSKHVGISICFIYSIYFSSHHLDLFVSLQLQWFHFHINYDSFKLDPQASRNTWS